MQDNYYINGIIVGKAAKALVTFFSRIRHQLLLKADRSKWKKSRKYFIHWYDFYSYWIGIICFLACSRGD